MSESNDGFDETAAAYANFIEPAPDPAPDIAATLARLDALDEDEMRVVQRVVDRLDGMRKAGPHWQNRGSASALDEALSFELTDVRLERERST